jgi:hypothetical protein
MYRLFILPVVCTLFACEPQELKGPEVRPVDEFQNYWKNGLAEINVFELSQVMYGEVHSGEAVMIFEPDEISKRSLVKWNENLIPEDEKIQALRMNATKRFTTGIEPHSMMLSSFVAIQGIAPWQALKLTLSSQDWRGQVFSQLIRRPDHYAYNRLSYLQKDMETKVERFMTEDALWNLLRINPDAVFQSDSLRVIPSLFYISLTDKPLRPYLASTKKIMLDDGNRLFQIMYPELQRTLFIEYEGEFPYRIIRWTEEYKDGSGPQAKELSTTGIRKKIIQLNYQDKHRVQDDSLRLLLDWKIPTIDTLEL